jgi:hypothetical protein
LCQEQVRRITLDEAVQLFNRNNLELQISRAASSEVAGLARQTRAYPNPVAAVTHESVSNQGLDFTETYYMLTQSIDWPWRYSSRRKAGSQRADAAVAELRADSARLVFELKRAYVEAAAAEAVRDVVDRVTAVFREADGSGTARLEEGDISRFELKRIRIERARYEQFLMETELELERRRRRLTALTLPVDSGVALAPIGPLTGHPHYNRLLSEGKTPRDAVFQGSIERLNPILMTALTAALALLPLAMGGGEPGKEIQAPMAIVVLGGLLTSTALNMVVVPVLFLKYGVGEEGK